MRLNTVRQRIGSRSNAAQRWARTHRRGSGLIAVAAVALVVLATVNALQTFGPIRVHGDGPLGPYGGSGFSFTPSDPGPWTQGYELCLAQGIVPAVVERISAASVAGSGLTYLGAYVRQYSTAQGYNNALGGMKGFPPAVPGVLHPADGFPVTTACTTTGVPPVYTELDVGFGKPAHSTGGGWTGIDVAYRVGATQYVVTLDYSVYSCGPSAPAIASCEAFTTPSPGTAG